MCGYVTAALMLLNVCILICSRVRIQTTHNDSYWPFLRTLYPSISRFFFSCSNPSGMLSVSFLTLIQVNRMKLLSTLHTLGTDDDELRYGRCSCKCVFITPVRFGLVSPFTA